MTLMKPSRLFLLVGSTCTMVPSLISIACYPYAKRYGIPIRKKPAPLRSIRKAFPFIMKVASLDVSRQLSKFGELLCRPIRFLGSVRPYTHALEH